MKSRYLIPAAALMLAVTACTDEDYDVTIDTPAIPFDAEMEAALSHYDVLGKYTAEVGVPMGVSVNPETLNAQTLLFSIVKTNFTQVEAPGLFLPVNLFSEGTYDFAGLNTLKTAAGEAGVSVFGPAICSLANQPQEYLDGLIAPIIIPYVPTLPESGEFVINDFESCKIGDTFPMTNGSTATVEYDPDAVSGNVLHIGSAETPAAQSFATFTVTMPDGRPLGDLKLISFDMKAEGSTGLYGQGLRLIINGTTLSFGSGTWGRGLIKLEIDQANFSAADQALNTFTVSLGSATGSGNYYIDNIAAKWEVPGDDPGTDVAVDFEKDAIGKNYPITNGGICVIAEDPDGKSGHVLQVGSNDAPVNQSFPKIHVDLPNGHKLGDYVSMSLDCLVHQGQWGQGMRFIINDGQATNTVGPAAYGCQVGKWARGVIHVSFVEGEEYYMALTDAEKELTSFDLTVGSATGAGYYYLDNITFKRIVSTEDTVIEKTDEEKKELISGAFDTWLTAVLGASDGISDMIIYDEPLDNVIATFNYADYMGESWVADAQKKAYEASASPRRYFVSQTLAITDNFADDIADLKAEIEKLEAAGVRVDAVNLVLSTTYSEDYATQLEHDKKAEAAIRSLSALGKPVRVSNFAVRVLSAGGLTVKPSTIGISERQAIGSFYAKVIKAYKAALGENAIGFNLSNVLEDDVYVAPWAAGGNRNYIYEGLVNGLTK